jgi:hypothetical protein
MVQTALAVEAGGSYNVSDWAPAMRTVGEAPGEVCYTYPSCMELIRSGEDVDYEGVTGPGTYSEGGVNAVTPAFLPFNEDGTTGEPVLLDAEKGLEILSENQTEATCVDWGACVWLQSGASLKRLEGALPPSGERALSCPRLLAILAPCSTTDSRTCPTTGRCGPSPMPTV